MSHCLGKIYYTFVEDWEKKMKLYWIFVEAAKQICIYAFVEVGKIPLSIL